MKRREYLTGVAGVGALTTVGAVGSVGASTSNHVIGTIPDREGDDDGPGGFGYPTGGSDQIKAGIFDMLDVTVTDEGDSWGFEISLAGPINNPFSGDAGFSVPAFQMYIRDPDAGSDAPTSTNGRPGSGLTFAGPYHYVAHITGNKQWIETANSEDDPFATEPSSFTEDQRDIVAKGSASANVDAGTVMFTIPKDAIGGGSIENKEIALFSFSQDGFGVGGIRNGVAIETSDWSINVGDNPLSNIPKAFDMLDPNGDQYDQLSYSADAPAEVSLVSVSDAFVPENTGGSGDGGDTGGGSDEPSEPADSDGDGVPDDEDFAPNDPSIQDPPAGPEGEPSEALPGAEGTPQSLDRDGWVEDIDGDGDGDADDVAMLFEHRNSDAVQSNSQYYDYNEDGRVSISDVVELYNKLFR